MFVNSDGTTNFKPSTKSNIANDPLNGFSYDEETDYWHFTFTLVNDVVLHSRFCVNISIESVIKTSFGNTTFYSNEYPLSFLNSTDDDIEAECGLVKNVDLYFDNTFFSNSSHKTLQNYADILGVNFKSDTTAVVPNSLEGIANWFNNLITTDKYRPYISNIYAFMLVADAYNVGLQFYEASKQTSGNSPFRIPYYDPNHKTGKYLTKKDGNSTELGTWITTDPNLLDDDGNLLPGYTEEDRLNTGRPILNSDMSNFSTEVHITEISNSPKSKTMTADYTQSVISGNDTSSYDEYVGVVRGSPESGYGAYTWPSYISTTVKAKSSLAFKAIFTPEYPEMEKLANLFFTTTNINQYSKVSLQPEASLDGCLRYACSGAYSTSVTEYKNTLNNMFN